MTATARRPKLVNVIAPQLRGLVVPIGSLRAHPRNPNAGDVGSIAESLDTFAQYAPVVAQRSTGYIVKGNHTWLAAQQLGWTEIAANVMDLDDTAAAAILAGDNRHSELGERDPSRLAGLLNELARADALAGTGYAPDDVADLIEQLTPGSAAYVGRGDELAEGEGQGSPWTVPEKETSQNPTLVERFTVPPFTVLDTRQGYWRERKRWWIARGVNGVPGREADERGVERRLVYVKGDRDEANLDPVSQKMLQRAPGSSVFDPVLCEVVYRWFCLPGGGVFDPFAGEATKGLVAGMLGLRYTGVELREEQVGTNRRLAKDLGLDAARVIWRAGDSARLDDLALPGGHDLIFTSPPYYDLETYSKREKDGSAFATYARFMAWYEGIWTQALALLADDRFVVVKVGDARDEKTGAYYPFVADNVAMFTRLGLRYYNEAILLTVYGSLPLRTAKQFQASRKLGKTHQNVLIFYKGDPRRIKGLYPDTVQFGDPDDYLLRAMAAEDVDDEADEAKGEGDDGDAAA